MLTKVYMCLNRFQQRNILKKITVMAKTAFLQYASFCTSRKSLWCYTFFHWLGRSDVSRTTSRDGDCGLMLLSLDSYMGLPIPLIRSW